MFHRVRRHLAYGVSLGTAVAGLLICAPGRAQQSPNPPTMRVVPPQQAWPALQPTEPVQALPKPPGKPVITDQLPGEEVQLWSFTPEVTPRQQYTPPELAAKLLQAPISHNAPGGVVITPGIENPYAKDPDAAKRGLSHFIAFNCVACHAPNGGGGMGPSLSDMKWRFGSEPPNIFMTIVQGRSTGMPAFGGMLPDKAIWELVAYVQSIAQKPDHPHEGVTISRSPLSPSIQQVPAEVILSDNPWQYTEPFSNGQKPAMTVNAAANLPEAPAALPGAPAMVYPPERIPQSPPEQQAAAAPALPPPGHEPNPSAAKNLTPGAGEEHAPAQQTGNAAPPPSHQ